MIRGLLSNQNMNIVTNIIRYQGQKVKKPFDPNIIITEKINTSDFGERLISSKYRKNELSFWSADAKSLGNGLQDSEIFFRHLIYIGKNVLNW